MKKKWLKRIGIILGLIVIGIGLMMGLMVYKVKNGFPVSYETEAPTFNFPNDETPKILVFSKTTGFRHEESIDASKAVYDNLAKKNNWFLYQTEEGGVFNKEQLNQFDVVIFNNSTGRVLNEEQQDIMKSYIENGGSFIGVHGSGDDSHHNWAWYETALIGSRFSHHSLDPHIQEATLRIEQKTDSILTNNLPTSWQHQEEWYVFFTNPKDDGFTLFADIDGTSIIPNGNLLWIKDKNFGMGQSHPVAWYKHVGKGKTFYTSLGHQGAIWSDENFLTILSNAINWSME